MIAGDHIYSPRTGYTHHGIYIGNGKVIHYSGFADGMKSGDICIATLEEFGNGNSIKVLERPFRVFNHSETVDRAYSRLGEDAYSLLFNNCEHFVNWCINGMHESKQVNNAFEMAEHLSHSYKDIAYEKNNTLTPSTIPMKSPITMGDITPTTIPTNLPILGSPAAIAAGIATLALAKEVIDTASNSSSSEISESLTEAVDSTAEYIGETVEEIGEAIDSVVTGAIDFIGSIFD